MSFSELRLGLAAGSLFTLALAAPIMAQTEYQGGGFISNFSTACAADGWSGTAQMIVRARPSGLPGNNASENIVNIFVNNFVMHYRFPQEPFGSGGWSTATQYANIGGGFGMNPTTMPRLRELTEPAGTIFGGDDAFHVVAEIQHFGGVTNCTARLNGWAHRR